MQNHASTSVATTPRTLACVSCQQRKIKCDRIFPCANCTKVNVFCVPSTRAPFRGRKRPNQVFEEKLTKLEALLEQHAVARAFPKGPSAETLDTTLLSQEALQASSTPDSTLLLRSTEASQSSPQLSGKLVVQDGSVKFIDSYIWGIVYENLQELRQAIDAETSEDQDVSACDVSMSEDHIDLLLTAIPSVDLDDPVPLPIQVFRLWQIFVDRVNPVTKLIHVPTLQPILIIAITDHATIATKYQALLFAIYLASVVSMSDKETMTMLGICKDEAIRRFAVGVKTALTKVNFLVNYDITTLQALVLYLVCLQGRSDHHALWVVTGVVIRIAYKMGLHRDGKTLNLSPFETEMRRRVWWSIVALDSMYAATSGLGETLLPTGSNTEMPENVNDDDFFPGSSEIQASDGPTEMVFCLMLYATVSFFRSNPVVDLEHSVLNGQVAEPLTADYAVCQATLERLTTLSEELEAELLDIENRYCNPSWGSVHILAAAIRPWIVKEIRTMLIPMRETPEWGTEVNNVHDNIFRIWLSHYENLVSFYGSSYNNRFLWFHKNHFQLGTFIFLVSQLVSRPHIGMFADRGWLIIDRVYQYHQQLSDMNQRQHVQLASLVLKGWEARESSHLQLGIWLDVPACVTKLKISMPEPSLGASDQVLESFQLHAGGIDRQVISSIPFSMSGQLLDPLRGGWGSSRFHNGDVTG
ncbi:fungal-specific transcription factor domain-containing protein [Ilyonectria robusta]|uniref:fungal-specific transcription factor domain-containing protein n=1 Tax=Ilyonectria robusta TaxID=1079257 RepID=UPI001E8E1883|nr:fungal-specific transcription factor domain-containing protein [Ilyonectria robusta]KAH8650777.1 fungal-specific transcription factor domain-containing protein [Ilyonectria robusta]